MRAGSRAAPWAHAADAGGHGSRGAARRAHVVIAGERVARRARRCWRCTRRGFRPFDDLLVVDDASRATLARLVPFAAGLRPVDGRATAFVCVDHACRLPVTEPEAFAAQLDDDAPRGARVQTENA